jgi:hypothetical protein
MSMGLVLGLILGRLVARRPRPVEPAAVKTKAKKRKSI